MHVLLLLVALLRRAAADLHRARLVVRAVRARHQLAVRAVPGEPALQVVLLRRRVVQRARHDVHHAVRQVQRLVELATVLDHVLVHVPALLRLADHELLHLVELVHAEDAPRVLPVRARLLPEVRREARVLQRQVLLVQPLAHVVPADRLLRRRDQVLLVALLARHVVQLLVEVLQLRHARHHVLVHEVRRLQRREAALRVPVQRVHDDRLVQQHRIALQEVSAVARHARAAFRLVTIDHPQQLVVAVHLSGHFARPAPLPHDAVVVLSFNIEEYNYLILIDNARVRKDVADLSQLGVALHTRGLHLLLRLRDLLRNLLHLLGLLGGVFASLSLLADLQLTHFMLPYGRGENSLLLLHVVDHASEVSPLLRHNGSSTSPTSSSAITSSTSSTLAKRFFWD